MRPSLGIDIAAPAELAWLEIIEVRNWPHWGPTVRAARLDDGAGSLSAGAEGAVQTPVGLWLPFEVVDWVDAGPRRSWSWRGGGGPPTTHSVVSRGTSRCRVEMSVPLLATGYLTVVALALARIRRRVEDKARS